MTTTRLLVRNALIARLETTTGMTALRNLDFAVEDRNLPALAVQSGNDDYYPEASTIAGDAGQARFGVVLLVEASDDPEAAADVFEAAIRADLKANPTLSGAAISLRYLGGEWDFDYGDLALRRLIFEVIFTN
jgi:hypothetical protein